MRLLTVWTLRSAPIAPKTVEPRLVKRNPEPRAGRHGEAELAVIERLDEDLLGDQQRAEELGAPLEVRQAREEMGRGDGGDGTLKHGAAVEADAGRIGDGCDTSRGKEAA